MISLLFQAIVPLSGMRPAMPWYSSSSTMPSIPALLRSAAIATAVARHAQSMPNVVCTDSSGKILNIGVFLMDFSFFLCHLSGLVSQEGPSAKTLRRSPDQGPSTPTLATSATAGTSSAAAGTGGAWARPAGAWGGGLAAPGSRGQLQDVARMTPLSIDTSAAASSYRSLGQSAFRYPALLDLATGAPLEGIQGNIDRAIALERSLGPRNVPLERLGEQWEAVVREYPKLKRSGTGQFMPGCLPEDSLFRPSQVPPELLLDWSSDPMVQLGLFQKWVAYSARELESRSDLISSTVSYPAPDYAGLIGDVPLSSRCWMGIRTPLERASAIPVDWGNENVRDAEICRRQYGFRPSMYEVLNSSSESLQAYFKSTDTPYVVRRRMSKVWKASRRAAVAAWDKRRSKQAICPNCNHHFAHPNYNMDVWADPSDEDCNLPEDATANLHRLGSFWVGSLRDLGMGSGSDIPRSFPPSGAQ